MGPEPSPFLLPELRSGGDEPPKVISGGGAMTLRLQQPGGVTGPVANWGRGQVHLAGSTPPRQAPWGL